MTEDRNSIGLTPANKDYIKIVKDNMKFKDLLAIGKMAFSYALRMNYDSEIRSFSEGTTTVWNIGSLDTDHELFDIVNFLAPDIERPYDYIEAAINVGLKHLRDLFPSGDINLISLMDN